MKELALEAKPGPFRAMIDRIKNRGAGLAELLRDAPDFIGGVPKDVAAEVYRKYQSSLRMQGAVDFNDLLLLTIELFEQQPEVLHKVRQRARFIHVDEYQDTNPVQYALTRLLAGERPNLMVVGDPDQSIYGSGAPTSTTSSTSPKTTPVPGLFAWRKITARAAVSFR